MKKRIVIILLASSFLLTAQLDSLQFEKYTINEGLSDNEVNTITQDNTGYIWIGTQNGLNRFDGSTFECYYQGQPPFKLPGNYISKLQLLQDGSIGLLTGKGFMKINPLNGRSKNYCIQDTTYFYTYLNNVSDAVEFNNGRYGVSTNTGFYVFNQDGSIYYRHDHYTKKSPKLSRVGFGREILKVSEDEIILYTKKGPVYFNARTKKFENLKPDSGQYSKFWPNQDSWTVQKQLNKNEFLILSFFENTMYYYNTKTNKMVGTKIEADIANDLGWGSQIIPYHDTAYLINGTYGGLYIFYLDKNTGLVQFKSKKQLIEYNCKGMFVDKENRLWIATDNGLLKQKSNHFQVKYWKLYDSKKTTKNAFFNIIFITKNYIFLTRYAKEDGFFIIDSKTMQVKKKLTFEDSKKHWNSVINISVYHEDTLWISCFPGVLWLDLKNFNHGKVNLPSDLQNRMLLLGELNSKGEAWMCSYMQNFAARYNAKTRSFTTFNNTSKPAFKLMSPKNILYDADSNVWFTGHGLTRYNIKTNTFDTLIDYFAGQNKFERNIHCSTSDRLGSIWFHTIDNGLLQYNTRSKTYSVFTVANGLPSDVISIMSPVIKDKLCFTSKEKLVIFNIKDKSSITLDQQDGLPENSFTGTEIYYDKFSSKMFAAMNNYLMSFNPGADNASKNQKLLLIDELTLRNNDIIYNPPKTMYLNYDQNNLIIKISVIDFESRTPYDFSYTLNDSADVQHIAEPVIHLNNLDYGVNTLNIRAKNKYNTVLNKQIIINIRVPFWRTWWFVTCIAIVIAFIFYRIMVARLSKINREVSLNQQLSEFELKALHAQMNPHFIFNCLNSIKALIMYKRNEEATAYLGKFSSLVRLNLDHSRKQFLTLKQNIDYIKQYIEIEVIRFNDLEFEIHVAPEIDKDEVKIAPMLLQPLIENAIWHGLQPMENCKKLIITFNIKNERLICEINDNGVGINKTMVLPKKDHTSLGIDNIQKRINLLNEKYNLNYILEIKDKSEFNTHETGTLVTLSFNYI